MRNLLFFLIPTSFFIITACETVPQTHESIDYEAAEAYIIACSKDWAETVVTGDRTKRRTYFAEDFVGTSTSGSRYDYEAITRETGPAQYIVSNTLDEIDIRFYDDMAIAWGSETWVKKDGSTGRFVWTDIWAYENGKWEIVAAQDAAASVDE